VIEALNSEEAQHVWVCTDTEFTTAFPSGMEPDIAVVAAIRAFDPEYVPVLCRKAYKTPTNADVAFGYHVFARFIDCPKWPKPALKLTSSAQWLNGMDAERIYEQKMWADLPAEGTQAYRECWPPIYRPHDWRLHRWAQAAYKAYFGELKTIKEQVAEFVQAQKEHGERKLAFIEDDARHEMKSLVTRAHIRKAVELENFEPEAPPDPQLYTQAEKVLGAPKAKTAAEGAA
jgi:hypothetical protein